MNIELLYWRAAWGAGIYFDTNKGKHFYITTWQSQPDELKDDAEIADLVRVCRLKPEKIGFDNENELRGYLLFHKLQIDGK